MFRPHVAEGVTSDAHPMEVTTGVAKPGFGPGNFPPIGTLPAEVGQLRGSKDCDQPCQGTL